jgi:transposase
MPVRASAPRPRSEPVQALSTSATEAANASIKRTGRGYHDPAPYRARILLTSAARAAA